MLKIITAICVICFLLSACNSDEILVNPSKNERSEIELITDHDDEAFYCKDVTPIVLDNNSNLKGCLVKDSRWTIGQTIRIRFLGGDGITQNKVKVFAEQWLNYANLKFKYVSATESSDIRIDFKSGDGSWSQLGTYCRFISANSPTMNFGWLNANTTNSEYSRVVIHEFGHALGLEHEHQSPAANIPWNLPALYAYYSGSPNFWSPSEVDYNIVTKLSASSTNYSTFDPKSIMIYGYPASVTTDGSSVGNNILLSDVDKNFITQMYPFPTPNTRMQLLRYYFSGKHFYTSNYQEKLYNDIEQSLGYIQNKQLPNSKPIYRYFNRKNGDRLITINYEELRGGNSSWTYEGIIGYAYATNITGTLPIYRYYNGSDHLLTNSYNELGSGKNGYRYEGIAFYIEE